MKIAIQGHPTRGKEVIQILESLGGKNYALFKGVNKDFWYFIGSDRHITTEYQNILIHSGFKTYTLEEFEKEFLFKVGDIILIKGVTKPYEIIELELYRGKLCYKLDNGLHYDPKELTTYEKMKEERNITLTLDKAKEWYKKGGELKEVALQAFSEKELNSIPRSWEEFCKNYPIKDREAHVDSISNIVIQNGNTGYRTSIRDRNICPSKKSAESHLAMIQLEQLRNCWWNGWEPEWNNSEKHVIKWEGNNLTVFTAGRIHAFLVFPTREMAKDFLECFRDLIEKAGDLI